MSWLIPLLLLRDLSKEERSKVTAQLLPLALPGTPTTRLAFATITAEREVRRQTVVEQNLVTEAIKAAGITSADGLVDFPALNTAFSKLPTAVKSGIFSPAVPGPPSDREIALATNPESGASAPAPARRSSNQPATRPT